ncbi:predicted protein, partial [Haematococcus lacustris]
MRELAPTRRAAHNSWGRARCIHAVAYTGPETSLYKLPLLQTRHVLLPGVTGRWKSELPAQPTSRHMPEQATSPAFLNSCHSHYWQHQQHQHRSISRAPCCPQSPSRTISTCSLAYKVGVMVTVKSMEEVEQGQLDVEYQAGCRLQLLSVSAWQPHPVGYAMSLHDTRAEGSSEEDAVARAEQQLYRQLKQVVKLAGVGAAGQDSMGAAHGGQRQPLPHQLPSYLL